MQENVKHLVIVARSGGITIDELVTEIKRHYVLAVLHDSHGSQVRAARDLGVHRNTLSRMIDELQIDSRGIRQAWLRKKPVSSEGGDFEARRYGR